ncbi:isoprenylcysteine carboxyl methyltransferase (ICMT) family protein [Sarocladium implicatum]|nr:isoprenylcysteine carboxyl methyltransferase (ICMT) family protein [Sarocladium implicatum]
MSILTQTSLAVSMGLCCAGTFLGFTSPNKNPDAAPSSGDIAQNKPFYLFLSTASRAPTAVGLYATYLAYRWPLIHDPLTGTNLSSVNPALFTWSMSTALPMALLLGAGIPLRLFSFSGLGKNFTYKLSEPDELVTTGLYRWVQHPSYTGIIALFIGNGLLFLRPDGVLRLLAPSVELSDTLMAFWAVGGVSFICLMTMALSKRVKQEEQLLKNVFGKQWIEWHSRTARFIPGLW